MTPRELAESVIGTSKAIHDELGAFSLTELADFDAICFECDICGWWFDRDDAFDDETCNACAGVDE